MSDAALDAFLAQAWERLADGVSDRRSPFHTPVLATVGADGRPRARTVVLREADATAGMLRIHCDRRSQKAAEIAREPRVALHAYDAVGRIQVRIEGTVTLHLDDTAAETAWEAALAMSRRTYGIAPGPGTPIPEAAAYAMAEDADIEAGRANFAVLTILAEGIDVLTLAHEGHRRAIADLRADTATWVVP